MKSLFDVNGTFFQFLSRVGDLIILNFLFLLCSLPIVTLGASWAAMYRVLVDMVQETEGATVKSFFRAFRANFRQATISWLVMLVVLVSLGCDLLLVITYLGDSTLVKVLLAVLAALVLGVYSYMLPLIVRYDNTLRQHLSNAIVLSIIKLPRTAAMVFLNLAPFLIAWVSLTVFAQTLIFWLFIGFSFVAFLTAHLLRKVYAELEGGNNKVTLLR